MSGGRLVAAALALSLLVAGCGDDDKKPSAGAAGSTSSTTRDDGHGPGEDPDAHPPPTLVDPKTGKQGKIRDSDTYTAVAPPPVVFREPDIGTGAEAGDIPLEASITPACVEHGQEVTAVMKSAPGMTVAAQIKWPNEQFSGLDNTSGKAGPDSTLTWKVRVQPTALYGQADLMVAVIDEGNAARKGTSGSWHFVVTPPGRC